MQFVYGALLAMAAVLTAPACAFAFPDRPVHLVVPFSPGGTSDTIARVLADKLQDRLGKPVLVENRPGASTVTAAERVAKALPDGYTLLLASSTTFALLPALRPHLAIAAEGAWAPVGLVAETPVILSVRTGSDIQSFAGLLAQARARPGMVTYGTTGPGTAPHLIGAMIATTFQLDMLPVAYRGSTQVLADVLGGRIDLSIDPVGTARRYIDTGSLRPLATSATARLSQYPEVPTFADLGIANPCGSFWFGVAGPRGIPQMVLQRLQSELQAVLNDPDLEKALARHSIAVVRGDAEAFRRRVRVETARYRQLAEDAGIVIE
ncbi:Bug family tripartite tricarboxylate transporter substrate binding protein [Cupriavidus sp. 2TAF22]|uniref:Bug family tripartite tricarboxylate transporter substrate binding protein n=1 Tax=unclassified Cupriavidus TaxID=2640874 RepID=UPI003F8F3662